MAKSLRIILIVVIFIIFFEVGLISSYTIITSEVPDVKGLIDMQFEKIVGIFSLDNIGQVIMKNPTSVNIENKEDVALRLQMLTNVDGINLDSMNVTTDDNMDDKEISVIITGFGYEEPSSDSSQIVLSQEPSYKVVATATAHNSENFEIDIDTIKINSVLKLL